MLAKLLFLTILTMVGCTPKEDVNDELISDVEALTVSSGSDQNITTSSTTITGTISGKRLDNVTYLWKKTLGGNAVIQSPTSKSTVVSGLVSGNYVFRLEARRGTRLVGSDDVGVRVQLSSTTTGGTSSGGSSSSGGTTSGSTAGYVSAGSSGGSSSSGGTSTGYIRKNLLLESLFDERVETYDGRDLISIFKGLNTEYQRPESTSITLNTSIKRAGAGSARIELHKNDRVVSGSIRAEMTLLQDPGNSEHILGLSYYFPAATFKKDPGPELILQYHQSTYSGSPANSLWVQDGIIKYMHSNGDTGANKTTDIAPIEYDKWMDIVVHVKWSYSTDGMFDVWVNGVKKLSYVGKTNYKSPNTNYLKFGINKFSWAPDGLGWGSNQTERIFYIDEFRLGNKDATYNDVAPTPIVDGTTTGGTTTGGTVSGGSSSSGGSYTGTSGGSSSSGGSAGGTSGGSIGDSTAPTGTLAGAGTNASVSYSGTKDDYSDELNLRFRKGLSSFDSGLIKAVPTYHSIGVYVPATVGTKGKAMNLKYKKSGEAAFKDGFPLWFDARNNEFRGSLVRLEPGTSYVIQAIAENGETAQTTVSTWVWNPPVGETVALPATSSSTLTISRSGTPGAYLLYTNATIDMGVAQTGSGNCIDVKGSYIIIRGMNLKNCQGDGIELFAGATNVIIEKSDISGFGHGPGGAVVGPTAKIVPGDIESAGISCNGYNMTVSSKPNKITIRGNKIHDPRYGSIHWGYSHPNSANGISLNHCGGNNVFAYNEFYSEMGHFLMDGIGGSDNFTFEGFPAVDSDIYGNKISDCYDDGIEAEGGNRNVRIYDNYITQTMVGIAMATTSIGPAFVYNNITSVGGSWYNPNTALDSEERGPFFKLGTREGTYINGGRINIFHNTQLNPKAPSGVTTTKSMGHDGGLVNNGGTTINVYSRNNIYSTARLAGNGAAIYIDSGNDVNYDLVYGSVSMSGGVQNPNGFSGQAQYAVDVDPAVIKVTLPDAGGTYKATASYVESRDVASVGNFQLKSTSPGFGKALKLPGFNDQFTAPDVGAHQSGSTMMKFGTAAMP